MESILSTSVRIYSHVPGYCQRLWKETLSTCLSSVLFKKDLNSWKKLAMITKCLLLKPKRTGRKAKKFTKNWTLDRFEKWKRGEILELWNDTLKFQNVSNRNHESSLEIEQQRRCISMAREGSASKALQALSQSPVAPSNDETHKKLKEKHPTAEAPSNLQDFNPPKNIDFNINQIFSSFPKSTAAGPSGLRIDHIKEALNVDKTKIQILEK